MNAETRGRAEMVILMAFYGAWTDSRSLKAAVELAHHATGFTTESLKHYQEHWTALAAEIRRQFPKCQCRVCARPSQLNTELVRELPGFWRDWNRPVVVRGPEFDQAIAKFKAAAKKSREAANEMDRCCPRHMFWKLPLCNPPRAKSRHYLRLERKFKQLYREAGVFSKRVQAIYENPGWLKFYGFEGKLRLK